ATDAELDALFGAADPPLRMLLMLTAVMGLRISEALSAGWESYDVEHQTLTLKTKGGKFRQFPVPPVVAKTIDIAPRDTATFIAGLANRKTLSAIAVRERWRRLKRRLGIHADLTPHDLRRTAAVRIYRDTHDVLAAKALLGHDSLATTGRYLEPYEPEAMRVLRDSLAQ